ncbi:MAG: cation:proton antiporter [Opitutales bacterium]
MFPLAAVATTQDALWALCLAVGAGCLLTVCARKIDVPTIVLLLVGGFALGPEGLGLLNPSALGEFLPMVVSLAVGLILFEGGLTLDLRQFAHTSTIIRRLLTLGVLITWLGSAFFAWLVFDTTPSFALLMGSLVIVTGPTVIMPILKRIRIEPKLGAILHWEAVLIDSIGVFIAILCFEWVVEGGGAVALPNFLIRIVAGAAIGFIGGYLIYWFMKHGWVPNKTVNAFSLAGAMLIFGVTELVKPEGGLLAVTVAGLIIAFEKPRQLREVKAFKAEIVELLVGLVFLLLVANLEIRQFIVFFQNGGGWVLLAVILLVRPMGVFLSSWGTSLNWREKTLLGWIAPRGVVAASMTSLFALTLHNKSVAGTDPALLESFVYSIICATVLIQGFSAEFVAKLLKLRRPEPEDWVIIGAHHFGRELARRLYRPGEQNVILLDTNARNVSLAHREGLNALNCDGFEAEKLHENEQALSGAGYVLALTDNLELNQLIMQNWAEELSSETVFGWIPLKSPMRLDQMTGQPVFGDLVPPAVIGNELMQGESAFESVVWEEDKTLPSGDWHPLFVRRGKRLKAIPHDKALKKIARPGDEVICLRRSGDFLVRALRNGGFLKLECESIDTLAEQLAKTVSREVEGVSETVVLEELGSQEKFKRAFLGHGVAIPHIYVEDLEYRVCFVVCLPQGLAIPEYSETIDFVFFLISPVGDTENHLATLAEIARLCRAGSTHRQIKNARNIDEVLDVITNA